MPLLSYTKSRTSFESATPLELHDLNGFFDLYSFLGVAQNLCVDFLPVTWQRALEDAGLGGTSHIRQAPINAQMSYVFKCLKEKARQDERKAFRALISEVSVLGHASIRDHPNISKLEGVCWDVERTDNTHRIWPVLVFEKSPYGDLETFSSSTVFQKMSLRGRLDLCIDIGIAILYMHTSHIIHGDIKPQNIIIFDGEDGHYVAKVTDFGYSTIFRGNDLIEMPRSVPWNAPEHHYRGFESIDAMRMDVYSFGLVSLWLFFFNSEKKSHNDFLTALHNQTNLLDLSYSLVNVETKTFDLTVSERIKLMHFFELALAKDPRQRSSSFQQLIDELCPKRVEGIAPPSVHSDELFHDMPNFQLTSSLLQLYQVDNLVRSSIARCLIEKAEDSSHGTTNLCFTGPAFQAALCYRLGFGTTRNDEAAAMILKSTEIPSSSLDNQMRLIKMLNDESIFRDGNFSRFQLQGNLSMTVLPENYREFQEMDNVRRVYEREIKDISAILGELHPITLTLKSTYCSVLWSEGCWQRCVDIGLETLQGCRKLYGEFHRKTLQSKEDLVSFLAREGNWKEAEHMAAQLIETRAHMLGEDHMDTLASKAVLADTYLLSGKGKEAEALYRRIWEEYRVNFGPDHYFTLEVFTALGSTLWKLGRYSEAEEIESSVLETSLKVLGRNHPTTILRMHNLGATHLSMGKLKEAGDDFQECLELRMDVLGAVHPGTLASMKFLAAQLRSKGEWQDAEALQKRIIETEERSLGLEHPDLMDTKMNLAFIFREQGKFSEAEILETSALKICEGAYGQNDPRTLAARLALAATYFGQGLWKDAAILERAVMETYTKTLGKNHPVTLESMSNLAMTLTKLEQLFEAEVLENESLQYKKQALGPEHPESLKSIANLVNIYTKNHRYAEAEELGTQLVETNKRVLGESSIHAD